MALVAVAALAAGLGLVAMFPASADEAPLSQGKTATADPQWLSVDLGATTTISRVVLRWGRAYGKAFEIQVSDDAATWTDIYATSTGTGGTQTRNLAGSGRYVRMYGTARSTHYCLLAVRVRGLQWPEQPCHRDHRRRTHQRRTQRGTVRRHAELELGRHRRNYTDRPGRVDLHRQDRRGVLHRESGHPANAIDDNKPATRWSSKFSDPQWVKLDLGRTASIHKVVLQWENPPTPRHTSNVADRGDAWSSNASTRPTRSGGSSGSDLDRQGLGEVQVNLRCRADV